MYNSPSVRENEPYKLLRRRITTPPAADMKTWYRQWSTRNCSDGTRSEFGRVPWHDASADIPEETRVWTPNAEGKGLVTSIKYLNCEEVVGRCLPSTGPKTAAPPPACEAHSD